MNAPKVTVNPPKPAPSEVAPVEAADVVKDSKGRSIKIRTLDILYESRLAKIVGAEAAANTTYMLGYVFPAASVADIDGEEQVLPQTQREIDFAIQRVGREGLAAVMQRIVEQAKGEQDEGAVKN